MRRIDAGERRGAWEVLFLCRAVYAFNWYNIGAVLPLVRDSFGIGTAALAIILGAFLAGAAAFQLPAGFVAQRWGNRATSIIALGTMAAFGLASAAAPDWPILAAARFGVGAGAAFFFAPALGLITEYYPSGTRGRVIGWYNAGFSVGSGVGLFGGAVAGEVLGWRWALLFGGIALALAAGLALLRLPTMDRPAFRPMPARWAAAFAVLRSRSLWALALAVSGLWGAFYVAAQYYVLFASHVHPGWSLALDALVPALMIAAEVVGGPVGGARAERTGRLRSALVVWGLVTGAGLALVPFVPFAVVWPLFAILGYADGVVFAVLYLLPTYFPDLAPSEFALALALLNSIQIFVGTGIALGFGLIAARSGFMWAWIFAGAIAVIPLPLLKAVHRGPVPPPSTAAPMGYSGRGPAPDDSPVV